MKKIIMLFMCVSVVMCCAPVAADNMSGGVPYNPKAVKITGGAINGVNIGQTVRGVGLFTTMSASGDANATTYKLNSITTARAVAPTIGSGFCSSAAITKANGTTSFRVDLSGACTGATSSGVVSMPAAANDWNCVVQFLFKAAGNSEVFVLSTTSTTIGVVKRTSDAAFTPLNFAAGDVLTFICSGV